MIVAVDTNILVRFLVADEPEQARRARELFSLNTILIPTTVLLETEWVLRSAYGFGREEIENAFIRLCGLPQVVLDQPEVVRTALTGYGAGLDFADALHLTSSRRAQSFATFDQDLRKRADRLPNTVPVVEP